VRILVTGSRTWTDVRTLELQMRLALAKYDPRSIVVVHGDCPRGADHLADVFARRHQLAVEPHPADWRPGGVFDRGAGFKRNAEMVQLGADLCLAFIRAESRGATHCADLAEKAGIPVRRFLA
jgi:hypothetical protein